ncbi:MAG: arsenic efflux protein [Clostridia bacterium]|nr:arsenic efflux protein [Clostridia bacterium]
MTHILLHALEHAFLDAVKLFPFLFVTYFIMEVIEHTAGDKVTKIISRSGKVGPLAGAVLGAVPQCSFSAMASGLFSGRVITLGTLFAVFLSTSDEMLPVMISSRVSLSVLLTVLITKVLIGMVVGFAVDIVFRKKEEVKIGNICEEEGCHCEDGVFLSALRHSLGVFVFILAVGFVLEALIGFVGEDVLSGVMSGIPVLSNIISATVGLIPNCAASVIITELYLEGVISAGAMMSGLLTGAGVGTLVLFRTNRNYRENILIVLTLWGVGTAFGLLLDLVGFGALL